VPWKAAAFISLPTSGDKISQVEKKNVDETLKMPRGITTDVVTTCKPYAHSIY